MGKGSHMVGGRTYRNVITTNEQKPTGPIEPQKLKIITTAIIPDAPKIAPPIVGTDLSKMITTHDEPKATIDQQPDLVEIVSRYTTLEKRGKKHVGLCPFHSEKDPSFTVDAEKQLYHCFGCGAGGDVISFIEDIKDRPAVKVDEPIIMAETEPKKKPGRPKTKI